MMCILVRDDGAARAMAASANGTDPIAIRIVVMMMAIFDMVYAWTSSTAVAPNDARSCSVLAR